MGAHFIVSFTRGLINTLGSVFSVSVQPSGELACSGGEDDKAYVWKVSNGSILFECGGMTIVVRM